MVRGRISKVVVFLLCLVPLISLAWSWRTEHLTANPIEYITRFTGTWTLQLLCVTLAITPLRKLLRQPDLIRFRRMIGLFAFFYGVLHLITYLWLDRYFEWEILPAAVQRAGFFSFILKDVLKRPFITAGFTAFLLMTPLAFTSTRGWIRRLGGKRWQLLHRLVYFSAIAGVIHYYWLVKSDVRLPLLFAGIVGVLLLYRIAASIAARFKRAPSVSAARAGRAPAP